MCDICTRLFWKPFQQWPYHSEIFFEFLASRVVCTFLRRTIPTADDPALNSGFNCQQHINILRPKNETDTDEICWFSSISILQPIAKSLSCVRVSGHNLFYCKYSCNLAKKLEILAPFASKKCHELIKLAIHHHMIPVLLAATWYGRSSLIHFSCIGVAPPRLFTAQ